MTTIIEEEVCCAICGQSTEIAGIGSTNELGYPDLDFRPAEMRRSTMPFWVTECPFCGYCASDLEEAEEGVEAIISGSAFKSLRSGCESFSELARTFHLAAFIAAEAGDPFTAFQHTVCEAWSHDDQGDTVRARAARLNAVDYLNQAHLDEDQQIEDPGGDEAMAADLLRRAGEFERAIQVCRRALAEPRNIGLFGVFGHQIELSEIRDVERHSMGEVYHEEEEN